MENKKRTDLALKGVYCVLTVDPSSTELTDLYVSDPELWNHLLQRFEGNKMTVTLRGPKDYKRGLRMPPDVAGILIGGLDTVIEKLKTIRGELKTIRGGILDE